MLVFVVAFFALTSDVMSGLAGARPGPTPDVSPGMARCIMAALRRALVLAVTAALVGEMMGATHGVGYLLMNSVMVLDTAQTVAVFLFAALPCALVVAIVRGIEGLV